MEISHFWIRIWLIARTRVDRLDQSNAISRDEVLDPNVLTPENA